MLHLLRHTVHIARHQLQLGIAVAGTTGIGEGDPAGDVQLVVPCVELHHVICPPAQATGEVAEFYVLLLGRGVVQHHYQRGAVAQVGGNIAVHQAPGNAGFYALAYLQHHTSIGG